MGYRQKGIGEGTLRFLNSARQGDTLNDPKAHFDWSKIDGFDALVELALNLHWSWNHAADELWEGLDKELWTATQNPWVILRTVSKEKIKDVLSHPEFRQRLDSLLNRNRTSYSADAWFQNKHPNVALTSIAYFSMEFMLSEALPIYSGGLGNVAGDQLKAASDLGVPVVGVGLLYGQGYFRQDFDSDGRQQALYPVNDPGQLPIRPTATTQRRMATVADPNAGREDLAPLLGGFRWENKAVPARHQRLFELSGSPRHNQRALWRRCGDAPEAGDRSRDRWLAPAASVRLTA